MQDGPKAKEAIAAERLRTLLDNIPDLIYFKDLDGCFTQINHALARHFGLDDPELAVGKRDFDYFIHEHAQEAFEDEREIIRTGKALIGKEEKETFADGTVTWVTSTKMPLYDGGGKIIGTCGISRDITERKKLEEQLLRSQRLESIGTLASGMAHDLNNILAPILLSAPLIREALAPEYHSLVFAIEKSAQRGADIIKQVLTFAKGVEGERALLRPMVLIEEIAEIARQTFPKPIRIIHEDNPDAWKVSVDATQMHQVLLNLCVNARDAMPSGGTLTIGVANVELDQHYASMIPGAKSGRHVVLSIRDTGTGIPPEICDRIFDPFFTTKEVGKGTGLGLSTVSGIVKSHNGFINVYSEPGKGTTFKVYLPAFAEQDQSVKAPEIEKACHRGKGEVVLVVEDEVEIRCITETILKLSGYRVLTAGDGTEALAIYARQGEEIDLVLTDVMMPHFDGTALTRTLKKMNPAVKIVASSGNGNDVRVAELRLLEPQAILIKPYTKEQLLKTLHEVLNAPPHQEVV
jgi:PAS domain S-box-containing protein